MEKDLILYPEAAELKALGFDEPCLAGYSTSTEKLEYYSRPIVTKDSFTVDAPTYSQAFRFFREKYNLKGGIEYIGGETPETTWWDIYVIGHFNINTKEMSMKYQPYEQAELACLKKLIEIVKTK